jgi:hypothetical protein
VIAIGRAGVGEQDTGRADGCVAFIAEPFGAADLARLVGDCLSIPAGTAVQAGA